MLWAERFRRGIGRTSAPAVARTTPIDRKHLSRSPACHSVSLSLAVLSPIARSTRSTILARGLVGERRVRNNEGRGRIAFRRLFDSNGFWLHSRVSASRRRRLLSAAAAHLSVQQNATLRHQTCNVRSGANSHVRSLYLLPHDAVKCAARPPGHAVRCDSTLAKNSAPWHSRIPTSSARVYGVINLQVGGFLVSNVPDGR